jgi:hypothetical protein
MQPVERQLWRVLNASAITYLNLALLFGRTPQQLGIVAIDGAPIRQGGASPLQWVDHIGVPPGARVEFIVKSPPLGVPALFVTRGRHRACRRERPQPRPHCDQSRGRCARTAVRAARAGRAVAGSGPALDR